jgi:hypothetical protein
MKKILTKEIANNYIKNEIASRRDNIINREEAVIRECHFLEAGAAEILVNTELRFSQLHLTSLIEIKEEDAIVISQFLGRVLILDGLVSVSDGVASALSGFKGSYLRLKQLKEISETGAKDLASFEGATLVLPSLEPSQEVLEMLSRFKGKELEVNVAIRKKLLFIKNKFIEHKGKAGGFQPPKEWQDGRIVLEDPPAAPLKGAKSERKDASECSVWFIPNSVVKWFTERLCEGHKIRMGSGSGFYGRGGKTVYISPEAANLLSFKAEEWIWLHSLQAKEEKQRKKAERSLEPIESPSEFATGAIKLARPKHPIESVFCWKPDFEGENYKAVLWFRDLLPANHKCLTKDAKGFPAKTMSPEAAALFKQNRNFWLASFHQQAREKTARAAKSLETAAEKAGLSKQELDEKLTRLAELTEAGNIQLTADMISGFDAPWVFEALLAGSSVNENGVFTPGKPLKRFKKQASTLGLLALAYVSEKAQIDPSLKRERVRQIKITENNIDIFTAHFEPFFPNLDRTQEPDLSGLDHLSLDGAKALVGCLSPISFPSTIPRLIPELARELIPYSGPEIDFGTTEIDTEVAAILSKSKAVSIATKTNCIPAILELSTFPGNLKLRETLSLSPEEAKVLAKHKGLLDFILLYPEDSEIDHFLKVIKCFSKHQGGILTVDVPNGVNSDSLVDPDNFKIHPEIAAALGRCPFTLSFPDFQFCEEFGDSEEFILLAQKLVEHEDLEFFLKKLPFAIAEILRKCQGSLSIDVVDWTPESLIEILQHEGPTIVGGLKEIPVECFSKIALRSSLHSLSLRVDVISDEAAEALSQFAGDLVLKGNLIPESFIGAEKRPKATWPAFGKIELSPDAATLLTRRRSLQIMRSKISARSRKVFEEMGYWEGEIWIRTAV